MKGVDEMYFQRAARLHLFLEKADHQIHLMEGKFEEVCLYKYCFDIVGMFGFLWQSNFGHNSYGINGHMELLLCSFWNQK